MRLTVVVILLISGLASVQSQDIQKIDSLTHELITERKDTVKVRLLNEIADAYKYSQKDTALRYANKALDLSKEIRYARGEALSLGTIAEAHLQHGENPLAIENFQEALEIYDRLGDRRSVADAYYSIGLTYFQMGQYEKVFEYDERASLIYTQLGIKEGLANALNNNAWVYHIQGDQEKAIHTLENAIILAEESGDLRTNARVVNSLGQMYRGLGKLDEAARQFEESYELSARSGDIGNMSYSLNTLGVIYGDKGDHQKALETYRRALELAKTKGIKSQIGRALHRIAKTYSAMSDWVEALEYAQRALKVSQDIKDDYLAADCYISIGIANYYSGEYETAIDYNTRAMEIAEKHQNAVQMSNCLNNIGLCYELLGDLDRALDNYLRTLEIRELTGDKMGLPVVLSNIGNIYSNMEEYDRALAYFNRALKAAEESGSPREQARVLSNIGFLYKNLGRITKSRECYLASLDLSRDTGDKELIRRVLYNLSMLAKDAGNYRDAFGYYVQYHEIWDSIYNEQKLGQIREMEEKYQSEAKQLQIDMQEANLERQSLELQQQKTWRTMLMGGVVLILIVLGLVVNAFVQKRRENNKISSLNQEITDKNLLLEQHNEELEITLENLQQTQAQLIQSEKLAALGGLVAGVAHEINTPVGISVTAASSLMEETDRIADHYKSNRISRAEFKDYLNTASQSARLILSNMERAATMVQSFKQVSVDQSTEQQRRFRLKEYTEDVIRSLYPRIKEKQVEIDMDIDDRLELDSFPGAFSQILTNLVINSLIHGFDGSDRGSIKIAARSDGKDLVVEYHDDGKGIQQKDLNKIFNPFFTTNKKAGTGLGLHIVYNIVTQKLNGSIVCSSVREKGVSFKIKFPLNLISTDR